MTDEVIKLFRLDIARQFATMQMLAGAHAHGHWAEEPTNGRFSFETLAAASSPAVVTLTDLPLW